MISAFTGSSATGANPFHRPQTSVAYFPKSKLEVPLTAPPAVPSAPPTTAPTGPALAAPFCPPDCIPETAPDTGFPYPGDCAGADAVFPCPDECTAWQAWL